MGLVKKWPFFKLFFFRKYGPEKCLLRYSRAPKRVSRLQKREVQKVEKIGIFPKGLAHGFGPKMAIFPACFFRKYRPEKCPLRYSRVEKRLSRL